MEYKVSLWYNIEAENKEKAFEQFLDALDNFAGGINEVEIEIKEREI